MFPTSGGANKGKISLKKGRKQPISLIIVAQNLSQLFVGKAQGFEPAARLGVRQHPRTC
jgi:hypothetical protein